MNELQRLISYVQGRFGPPGMVHYIPLEIRFRCGLEAFNLQPYECYETCCGGYEVQCLRQDGRWRTVMGRDIETVAKRVVLACYEEEEVPA